MLNCLDRRLDERLSLRLDARCDKTGTRALTALPERIVQRTDTQRWHCILSCPDKRCFGLAGLAEFVIEHRLDLPEASCRVEAGPGIFGHMFGTTSAAGWDTADPAKCIIFNRYTHRHRPPSRWPPEGISGAPSEGRGRVFEELTYRYLGTGKVAPQGGETSRFGKRASACKKAKSRCLPKVVLTCDDRSVNQKQSTTTIGVLGGRKTRQTTGISLSDRLFHLYIIGQTRTGKSTLIKNLALADAAAGRGFCLIDPHGDLASAVSREVGMPHLYWNIADPNCPLGYNPIRPGGGFDQTARLLRSHRSLATPMGRRLGRTIWHLLRYAVLALLEQPKADIRDVVRLLIEKDFQKQALSRITDPQVRYFWEVEYQSMNYKNAIDGVAPDCQQTWCFSGPSAGAAGDVRAGGADPVSSSYG